MLPVGLGGYLRFFGAAFLAGFFVAFFTAFFAFFFVAIFHSPCDS